MTKPTIDRARRMTAKERDLIRSALRAAKRRGCDPYATADAAGAEWPRAFRLQGGR